MIKLPLTITTSFIFTHFAYTYIHIGFELLCRNRGPQVKITASSMWDANHAPGFSCLDVIAIDGHKGGCLTNFQFPILIQKKIYIYDQSKPT